MSAESRIFSRVLFSSASSRGVAVHGSLSQGMRSAMSCFSLDGFPAFARRAVLAGLGAGGQPVSEAVLLDETFDLALPIFMPPTSICEKISSRGASRFASWLLVRVERIEPVACLGKRIVLLRIDQQQGSAVSSRKSR